MRRLQRRAERLLLLCLIVGGVRGFISSLLSVAVFAAALLGSAILANALEGDIGTSLGEIAKAHPDTIIGSYPKYLDGKFWTELVVRSRSAESLAKAKGEVEAMLAAIATPA